LDVIENTTIQHCVLLLRKKDGKKYGKIVLKKTTGGIKGGNTGKKVREKESMGKSHVTSGHFRSRMRNGPIPLIDPPQI
jgi:hypothetical protein